MSSDSQQSAARFPSEIYSSRLARAAEYAGQAGLDALLISPGPDLRYLVGSQASSFERLICLVVPADGSTPTVLVPRLELAALQPSAVTELGLRVTDWVDGVSPYDIVADMLPSEAATAVDDAMPALHFVPLADKLGRTPILATEVLRRLRMLKDDSEIAALRRAGQAIDRVHARMGEFLKVGRTEAAVAAVGDGVDASRIADRGLLDFNIYAEMRGGPRRRTLDRRFAATSAATPTASNGRGSRRSSGHDEGL